MNNIHIVYVMDVQNFLVLAREKHISQIMLYTNDGDGDDDGYIYA